VTRPAAAVATYARRHWNRGLLNCLAQLRFDNDVLEWVRESLQASHTDERREHEEAVRRLQAEHKRLGDRINAMYLDKLDGRVDGAFFDKMSAQWREEQNRSMREIAWHESAEQSYMDEGVQILELAQNAQKLFDPQSSGRFRKRCGKMRNFPEADS
jgi:site-specific DNA recombinase